MDTYVLEDPAAAADDYLMTFFAAAALERTPAARRRYRAVADRLMAYLNTADLAPHLGSELAGALELERSRHRGHAFFRVCNFDDLICVLPGFVADEWLLPRPGDARTQVSLTGRLLVWLRRQRLLDMSVVACAYHDAERAVRDARDRLSLPRRSVPARHASVAPLCLVRD